MKRKIVIAVIIVVALAILFTPARIQLRDGGSVVYKAITYSVTKYRNYETRGWKIVIFGITLAMIWKRSANTMNGQEAYEAQNCNRRDNSSSFGDTAIPHPYRIQRRRKR